MHSTLIVPNTPNFVEVPDGIQHDHIEKLSTVDALLFFCRHNNKILPQICKNSNFWSCGDAADGTHIELLVPNEDITTGADSTVADGGWL